MPEWPLGDAGRPDDARGLCPECGGEVGCAARPGSVSRCPRCRSWLYESLFDEASFETPDGAPCARCGSARLGETCVPCSGEATRQRAARKRRRSAETTEGVIRVLPLEAIEGDGPGLRHAVDVRVFDRLRRSVASIGLVEPILVRPTCIGTFEIVDGFRRWLALRQLGCPAIAARVVSMTAEQRARWRLATNLHREELAPLDEAESFFGAVGEAGQDKRTIAAALGLDARRVEQLVRECSRDAARYEAEIYGTAPPLSDESAPAPTAATDWSFEIDLSAEAPPTVPSQTPETGETGDYGPRESIELSIEENGERESGECETATDPAPELVPVGGSGDETQVARKPVSGESVWVRKSAGEKSPPAPPAEPEAEERESTGLRLVSGSVFERKVLDELKGRVQE